MHLHDSPTSYGLADHFTTTTEEAASSRLMTFAPGEGANEQLVLSQLGVNGWGRWQYFRTCFSGGWGEGHERPLSPRSQEMLFRALACLTYPEGVTPSLFLTDEGHLELAWQDRDGRAVQLELGSRTFEVFIEAAGLEATYPSEELEAVIGTHLAA